MNIKIVESNSPPLHEGVRIRKISEDQAGQLDFLFANAGMAQVRDNRSRYGLGQPLWSSARGTRLSLD